MGDRIERVVLIGLRRAGKTTVARVVASKIGWSVIDTDAMVLEQTGRTAGDWIEHHGIAAFREVESDAVSAAGAMRHVVIATGGGAPLSEKNRDILGLNALVAYLRADPWILRDRERIDPSTGARPRLTEVSTAEEPFVLHVERDALYRKFCNVVVDASRSPERAGAEVVEAFTLLATSIRD